MVPPSLDVQGGDVKTSLWTLLEQLVRQTCQPATSVLCFSTSLSPAGNSDRKATATHSTIMSTIFVCPNNGMAASVCDF